MSIADIMETMEYGPSPENPIVANAWLEGHDRQFNLFIDNQWIESTASNRLTVRNPATGQTLAHVADATCDDVAVAVTSARKAFKEWQETPGHVRARYLYAIARNIQKHARLFAVLESMDNGKPIRESRDIDIPLVARHFYYHAGWAQLADTAFFDHVPIGVVGQIIPWNFPLLMLAWKIAPALAMGNTVVLKPAPYTPLSALLFAEIVAESGLPKGVINIITGGDETGASLVSNEDVDKIAFTGSTQVGRILRQVTAGTGKRLSLELGGKSPYIVFEDADQDAAIEGLVDAIWFNQGQVCCAGSRLLVQESIAEAFLNKLRRRMSRLRTGDSLDKGIDIGAIVDQVQHENIQRWVQIGVDEGATIYQPDTPQPEQGCYYPPTLLTDVSPASTVAQQEIFGPVLVAMTFRTPAEAIEIANNTRYGLAASVWSENINLALEAAHKVKAGSVWVNCTNLFDAASGFGGYRESGYGREGGREGLHEYIRPIWLERPKPETMPQFNDERLVAWSSPPAHFPMLGSGSHHNDGSLPAIDRTTKLFIGGRQRRPDGNYSRPIFDPSGIEQGQVGEGNRKDIRDAVEVAHAAKAWADRTPHNRSQILYYIAENLSIREQEFVSRLITLTKCPKEHAQREVTATIDRLFTYAALADKYGGQIQETTLKGIVAAVNEYLGVIGIACPDETPLLSFISLVAPAIARGNTVVVIPSEQWPLLATDFYQILETSDLPAGVINIVTGSRDHLSRVLAEHEDVDAMWYFGSAEGSYFVESLSVSNLKRTWVNYGVSRNWFDREQGQGEEFLLAATQIKNIWIPTGV